MQAWKAFASSFSTNSCRAWFSSFTLRTSKSAVRLSAMNLSMQSCSWASGMKFPRLGTTGTPPHKQKRENEVSEWWSRAGGDAMRVGAALTWCSG